MGSPSAKANPACLPKSAVFVSAGVTAGGSSAASSPTPTSIRGLTTSPGRAPPTPLVAGESTTPVGRGGPALSASTSIRDLAMSPPRPLPATPTCTRHRHLDVPLPLPGDKRGHSGVAPVRVDGVTTPGAAARRRRDVSGLLRGCGGRGEKWLVGENQQMQKNPSGSPVHSALRRRQQSCSATSATPRRRVLRGGVGSGGVFLRGWERRGEEGEGG